VPLRRIRTFLSRPAGIVILTTVGLALLALIEGFLYAADVAILLRLVAFFAILGAFLGTIYATDSRSGLEVADRPILRTAVSIALGLAAALTVGLSATSALLSAVVLGALGWLGMTWAQYVDF